MPPLRGCSATAGDPGLRSPGRREGGRRNSPRRGADRSAVGYAATAPVRNLSGGSESVERPANARRSLTATFPVTARSRLRKLRRPRS